MRHGGGFEIPFNEYDLGATPFYATRLDPRCSFCLYVPSGYVHGETTALDAVVVVHGSDRPAERWRDALVGFAEQHQVLIVAPLFPAGLVVPFELENYKLWQPEFLRSDLVLLDILDTVRERWRIELSSVHLHGFSGGAQFAHRFLLLHPGELTSVSIAAPGAVTRIDDRFGWWAGTRDIEERFGRPVDLAAMRRVDVQLVVGSDDTDPDEPHVPEDSPLWVEGANEAGVTRVDRLHALAADYEAHGIPYRLDVVPGGVHDERTLGAAIQQFLAEAIARARRPEKEAERA